MKGILCVKWLYNGEITYLKDMPGAGSSFETRLKINLRLWLYAGTLFICLFLKLHFYFAYF